MIRTWEQRIEGQTPEAIMAAMLAEITEWRAEFEKRQKEPPAVSYQGGCDFRFTGLVDTFQRGTVLYLAAGVESNRTGRTGLQVAPRVERRRSAPVKRHDTFSCACAACADTRNNLTRRI